MSLLGEKKAIFVTLFKFIVCYLFFLYYLLKKKKRIIRLREQYKPCSLFSTLFLLPDENKYGCLKTVLVVTQRSEHNRAQNVETKRPVSTFGTLKSASRLTEPGNMAPRTFTFLGDVQHVPCRNCSATFSDRKMFSADSGRCCTSEFEF